MRKTFLRFMALSIVMLVMVSGMAMASGEVGTVAPEFSLTAQGGGVHNLSDYRGRVVVLFVIGYG